MQSGTKKAFVVNSGLSVSKNGNPFAFADMETKEGPIQWKGYLTTPKGIEIATKALVVMGFTGTDLNELNGEGALNKEKEVSIVVENEEYKGKTYSKVAWVNNYRSTEKKDLNTATLNEHLRETMKELGVETETIDTSTIPF